MPFFTREKLLNFTHETFMQDSADAIVKAAKGYVEDLADELDVTPKRMYELLSKDNPYPKVWRILRPLGRLNPARLRLVQADFNARCERIIKRFPPTNPARLNKELNDVMQARLEGRSKAEQVKEIDEAIAELYALRAELEA